MEELRKSKQPAGKTPLRLRLNTVGNVKKSLGRLTNAMLVDDANLSGLRGAVYAINALIAAYRVDYEFELDELRRRVESIEKGAER